jgi:nicotinamidase-related amidase
MKPVDSASTALLLVDVINDFEFEGSKDLLRSAVPAAEKIAGLRARLAARGVPVIYVNDNFGQWQSDFRDQVERCSAADCPGHPVVSLLRPGPDDYFVLKPKHSGFHSTSLEILLRFLHIETLILTGFATDICVVYTANDAYMREFKIIVPSDCVAAETDDLNRVSLRHIEQRLKAQVVASSDIR